MCSDNKNTHGAKFHKRCYPEMIYCFSVFSSDIVSGLYNKQACQSAAYFITPHKSLIFIYLLHQEASWENISKTDKRKKVSKCGYWGLQVLGLQC